MSSVFYRRTIVILLFLSIPAFYLAATAISHRVFAVEPETVSLEEELNALKQKRLARLGRIEILRKAEELQLKTADVRTIKAGTLSDYIGEHDKFIAVDLDAMELYLYREGDVEATIPIVSKGRPGSLWDTPSGIYEINTKEENHFSSIGEVYMPYSMQFFGNFFIHGWPYYPDGTEVPLGFSGGCIRLLTADAKKVFAFADKGTPLLIFDEREELSLTMPLKIRSDRPPAVSARAYLLADLSSGEVYAEKNSTIVYPIASLTKLMTAVVANETISFDREIAITGAEETQGDRGVLKKGDRFTVGELLYPLLMESNNAAARAISAYHGDDHFLSGMNDKALALEMKDTYFADPVGLSVNTLSSPEDLFRLAKYIAHKKPFIWEITRRKEKEIVAGSGRVYEFRNYNHFTEDPTFVGGKTGFTYEADETMLAIFKISISGKDRTLAAIVLGSEDREADIQALVSWFKSAAVSESDSFKIGLVGDIMLDGGVKETVTKQSPPDYRFLFNRIKEDLDTYHILAGNLEGGIVSPHSRALGTSREALRALKSVGFDVLSLANDNIARLTLSEVAATVASLGQEGLTAVGAGPDAYLPKMVRVGETEVSFLGFSEFGHETEPRVARLSEEVLVTSITRAKETADLIIVSIHFGEKYQKEPGLFERTMARVAIDAGADVVAGHYPHVVQTLERYKNGYIAYSLGNFIYDQAFSEETMKGGLLEIEVSRGAVKNVILRTTELNRNFQPEIVSETVLF